MGGPPTVRYRSSDVMSDRFSKPKHMTDNSIALSRAEQMFSSLSIWALADTHCCGNRRCLIHLTDIRDASSCGIVDVIGGSSLALIKRSDTTSRLYSAVVNSGGVTAKVPGEPLVIEGDPVVTPL